MSLLHQLSAAEIKRDYTHYGWFGFCPIYLNEDMADCMSVCERNGVPEWWFRVAEMFMSAAVFVLTAIDKNYEPQWGFIVTGEIAR